MGNNIKISLLFLFLFFGSILNAQEKPVRFGIRAGMNFSTMTFLDNSLPPENSTETTGKSGGVLGLLMIVPLSGNFFIQPEYLYSQMGGFTKYPQTKIDLNYLSMPVFLRWEAMPRFSLLAGPQLDFLINAKQKAQQSAEDLTENIEARSLGVTFGTDILFYQAFLLGIRYVVGINDVDYFWGMENEEFKNEMLQISLVYIFK